MKRQMLLAIAVLGTCFAVLGARQTTRVGVINDAETGTPIAGATVRVSESGKATTMPLISTASQEDGTFELPVDGVGGVLEVAAAGYATKRIL